MATNDDFDSLAQSYGVKLPKSPTSAPGNISAILSEMRGGTSAQESGGDHTAVNPLSNATGEFQIMEYNIPAWTEKHLKRRMSVEEFKKDKAAQQQVFDGEMGEYLQAALKKSGGDVDIAKRMAAAAWYGGPDDMDNYDSDAPIYYKGVRQPSYREYTSKVLKKGLNQNSSQPDASAAPTDFDSLSSSYLNLNESTPPPPETNFDALSQNYGVQPPVPEAGQDDPPIPNAPTGSGVLEDIRLKSPEEKKKFFMQRRTETADALKRSRIPARRKILTDRLKDIDKDLLRVAQEERAAAAPQTAASTAQATTPITQAAAPKTPVPPENNQAQQPDAKLPLHFFPPATQKLEDGTELKISNDRAGLTGNNHFRYASDSGDTFVMEVGETDAATGKYTVKLQAEKSSATSPKVLTTDDGRIFIEKGNNTENGKPLAPGEIKFRDTSLDKGGVVIAREIKTPDGKTAYEFRREGETWEQLAKTATSGGKRARIGGKITNAAGESSAQTVLSEAPIERAARPAASEEDFRAYAEYKGLTDTPQARAQFEKDLSANSSFGSSVQAAAELTGNISSEDGTLNQQILQQGDDQTPQIALTPPKTQVKSADPTLLNIENSYAGEYNFVVRNPAKRVLTVPEAVAESRKMLPRSLRETSELYEKITGKTMWYNEPGDLEIYEKYLAENGELPLSYPVNRVVQGFVDAYSQGGEDALREAISNPSLAAYKNYATNVPSSERKFDANAELREAEAEKRVRATFEGNSLIEAAKDTASEIVSNLNPLKAYNKFAEDYGFSSPEAEDSAVTKEILEQQEKDQKAEQIKSTYGSFENYERKMQEFDDLDPVTKTKEYWKHFGNVFVQGLLDMAKAVPLADALIEKGNPVNMVLPGDYNVSLRGLGNALNYFTSGEKTIDKMGDPAETGRIYRTLDWLKKEYTELNPFIQNSTGGEVGNGIVSALTFFGFGMAFRGSRLATALVGGAMETPQQYEQMRERGVSADAALFWSQAVGYPLGASEIAGIGGIAGRLGTFAALGAELRESTAKTFLKSVWDFTKSTGKHAISEAPEEGLQEWFQSATGQAAIEAIAAKDKSGAQKIREFFNQLPSQYGKAVPSALMGAAVGGIFGGGVGAANQVQEKLNDRRETPLAKMRDAAKKQFDLSRINVGDRTIATPEAAKSKLEEAAKLYKEANDLWISSQEQLQKAKKAKNFAERKELLKSSNEAMQQGNTLYERSEDIALEAQNLATGKTRIETELKPPSVVPEAVTEAPKTKPPFELRREQKLLDLGYSQSEIDQLGGRERQDIVDNQTPAAKPQATVENSAAPELSNSLGVSMLQDDVITPEPETPAIAEQPSNETDKRKPEVLTPTGEKPGLPPNEKPKTAAPSSVKLPAQKITAQGIALENKKSEKVDNLSSSAEKKTVHEFASTQFNLPTDKANKVLDFGKKLISDSELYTDPNDDSYGRETEPHFTARWGIESDEDIEKVRELLKNEKPFTVRLGKVSIFEGKGETPYDVVKLGVESEDLHRINKLLSDNLKVKETFPYDPHGTLAYVPKGKGQKYVGNSELEGEEITFNEMHFSGKNGEKIAIPLGGERANALKESESFNSSENDVKETAKSEHETSAQPKTPSFSEFLKNKGYERWYKSNRPIERFEESESKRISEKQFAEFEAEYEQLKNSPAESKPIATDAAHEAATSPLNDIAEPTKAQIEAGNYKKGHISIGGLNISVENPVGSLRKGTDKNGKAWSVTMGHHYGYIKGSTGADTEHIDVFVKDETPADFGGNVYIVDQVEPETGAFDEHKIMIGFDSEAEARAAYSANYAADWKGLKAITAMPMEEFKTWARDSEQNKPVASLEKPPEKKENGENSVSTDTVKTDVTATAAKPSMADIFKEQIRKRREAQSAAKPADKLADALKGIAEIMGDAAYLEKVKEPDTLKSALPENPEFVPATYDALLPHFESAFEVFSAGTPDASEQMGKLIDAMTAGGMSLDTIEKLEPYFVRFMEDAGTSATEAEVLKSAAETDERGDEEQKRDAKIEKIANKKPRKRAQADPKKHSLFTFVALSGGIRPNAVIDTDKLKGLKKGIRPVLHKNGRDVEDVMADAISAGYLTGIASDYKQSENYDASSFTANDFVDAVEADARRPGGQYFSVQSEKMDDKSIEDAQFEYYAEKADREKTQVGLTDLTDEEFYGVKTIDDFLADNEVRQILLNSEQNGKISDKDLTELFQIGHYDKGLEQTDVRNTIERLERELGSRQNPASATAKTQSAVDGENASDSDRSNQDAPSELYRPEPAEVIDESEPDEVTDDDLSFDFADEETANTAENPQTARTEESAKPPTPRYDVFGQELGVIPDSVKKRITGAVKRANQFNREIFQVARMSEIETGSRKGELADFKPAQNAIHEKRVEIFSEINKIREFEDLSEVNEVDSEIFLRSLNYDARLINELDKGSDFDAEKVQRIYREMREAEKLQTATAKQQSSFDQTDLFGNKVSAKTEQIGLFGASETAETEESFNSANIVATRAAFGDKTADFIGEMLHSKDKSVVRVAEEITVKGKLVESKGEAAKQIIENVSDALELFRTAIDQKSTVAEVLQQPRLDGVEFSEDAASFARAMETGNFAKIFGKALSEAKVIDLGDRPLYKKLSEDFTEDEKLTYEQMQQLPFAPFDELLQNAQATRFGDRIKSNAASHEIFRRAFEEAQIRGGVIKRGEKDYEDLFAGIFLPPDTVNRTISILQEKRDEAANLGYSEQEVAVFDEHINLLTEAAVVGKKTVVVYIFDKALPEELFHQADYLGAADKSILNRHSESSIKTLDAHGIVSKLWTKHFSKFNEYNRLVPEVRRAILRAEIPPFLLELSSAELAAFGITETERADYLLTWFEGYARKNGPDALDNFEKEEINAQEYIARIKRAAAEKQDERAGGQNENNSEKPGIPGGETRGSPESDSGNSKPETESAERVKPERPDSSQLPAGQRYASLPATLRRAGIDAEDIVYDVFGDVAARASAIKMLEENGIDGSVKLLEGMQNPDVDHAILSFMLQRILLDKAAMMEQSSPEDAAGIRRYAMELGRAHAEKAILAGRFTRAASIIAHSVEGVMYHAQETIRREFGDDKSLSAEELLRLQAVAEQSEAAFAQIVALKREKRNLQARIKRLESEKETKKSNRKKSSLAARQKVVDAVKSAQKAKVDEIRAKLLERFAPGTLKSVLSSEEGSRIRNLYEQTARTILSGKEIADFRTGGDIKAFREQAKDYAAQNVTGSYKVKSLGDKKVEIRPRGIKHALARFSAEDKIRAIAGLPELLQNGVLIRSEKDKNNRPLEIHHLIAPLTIGTNEYVARLVVREDINGALFYDHDLSDIKNLAALSKPSRTLRSVGGHGTQQDISILLENIFSVNKNGTEEDAGEPGTLKKAIESGLDEATIDDFAQVGAMLLTEGISGETDYLPEHFRAEMTGMFGDAISGDFEEIYRKSWNVRDEWLSIARSEKAASAVRVKYGEELSDDEVQEILDGQSEKMRHRRAINSLHSETSQRGTESEREQRVKNIIRDIAPDDAVAIAAEIIASGGSRAEAESSMDAKLSPMEKSRVYFDAVEIVDVARKEFAKLLAAEAENRNEADEVVIRLEELRREIKEAKTLGRKEHKKVLDKLKALNRLLERIKNVPAPKDAEQIADALARLAPDSKTAIAADLINRRTSPADIYAITGLSEPAGMLDAVKVARQQRELLRAADELLARAKIEISAENQKITEEILAARGEEKTLDDLLWEYRQANRRAQAAVADELLRIKKGEMSYRYGQVMDVLNVSRSLMASVDLSASLRQGGFFAFSAPEAQSKAYAAMFASFTEKGFGRVIQDIEAHPRFALAQQAGIDFAEAGKIDGGSSQGEENFKSTLAERIPVLGRFVVKTSERTYTSFLDAQRMTMFNLFAGELESSGLSYKRNPKEFEKIAQFINVATGRGTMPKSRAAELLLNLPLFAPRYTLSRLQLLNMTLNPVAYYNMPPAARKIVAKKSARFYGSTMAIIGLAALLGLVSFDDDESEFLKIKVGNTRYDIFAGTLQPARMLIRLVHAGIRGDRIPGEFWNSTAQAVGRFGRGKLSPLASLGVDWAMGADFVGNEFNWTRAISSRLVPLTLSEIYAAFETGGAAGVARSLPLSFFGIGVSNYETNKEALKTEAEKLSAKIKAMRVPDKPELQETKDNRAEAKKLTIRSRRGEDVTAEVAQLFKDKKISTKTKNDILNAKGKSLLLDLAEDISLKAGSEFVDSEFEAVWRVATETERLQLSPLFNKKMKNLDVAGELTPKRKIKLQNIGGRIVGDVAMPEKVREEFERLEIKTPDVGESITVRKDDKRKLSAEQYENYRKQTLESVYKRVESIINSDIYKEADELKREKLINRAINKSRERSQKQVKRELRQNQ